MVGTNVVSVEKVLLLLMIETNMLGLSTEGYVTPVQGVINYSSRNVILIGTSREPTWERNRTPALFVVKTLQRKLTSPYTTGLSIRVRNRTSAQIVDRSLHRGVILIDISREPTMPRNHFPARIVVKTFQRKQNSFYTYGVCTRERNPTPALCVVKVLV